MRLPGFVRVALGVAICAALVTVGAARATVGVDWSSYLFDVGHSSATSDATITTANAGTLTRAWTFVAAQPTMSGQPQRTFYASPTVVGGQVFIGSNTGVFYALSLATGKVVWQQFLGFQPKKTCNAIGLVSTAAAASDPTTGAEVVYVAGGDGYLYALNATDGSVVWRSVIAIPSTTVSDYFDWSSPTVANGKVYVGFASDCDNPFPPGGVAAFDQASGTRIATYYSVPGQGDGGGVWTSPVVSATGDVWATTGSGPAPPAPQGFMYSILHLDGTTLGQVDSWTVPLSQRGADADFASSPTLFTAAIAGVQTPMVAACNKNGLLYAWPQADLTDGPTWSTRVGLGTGQGAQSCLAAPIWDGQYLYDASNPTTIGGIAFKGSVRQLDPATGSAQWQTGLGGSIEGSPSVNGNGLIAAATYQPATGASNGTYLINSADGSIAAFLPTTSLQFSQPVFADGYLLLAQGSGFLIAYKPRATGNLSPPTTPASVQASWDPTASEINISWAPSTDDTSVASYRVFRNGGMIATLPATGTTFVDSNAQPTATNAYSVEAIDSTGNASPVSSTETVPPFSGHPLFSDGFESGTFGKWQSHTGMLLQQTTVSTGAWAAQMSSTGATKSFALANIPDTPTIYVETDFYLASQGPNQVNLLTLRTNTGQSIMILYLAANGTLATRSPSGVNAKSTTQLTPGTWHTILLQLTVNGTTGTSAISLDGQNIASLAKTGNYGTTPTSQLLVGDLTLGRSYNLYLDNVIADSQPLN